MARTPQEIMQSALVEMINGDVLEDPDPDAADLTEEKFRNAYLFFTAKRKGREEGQLIALRRVLVDILTARGVVIAKPTLARIQRCKDSTTLARWCTIAATASGPSLDLKP